MTNKLNSSIVEQQVQRIVFSTPRCKNWSKGLDLDALRTLAEMQSPERVASIDLGLSKYHNESWAELKVKGILDFFFCTDIPLLVDGYYLSVDITCKRKPSDLRFKLQKAQKFAPMVQPLLGVEVCPVIWSIKEAPTADAIKLAVKQSKQGGIVLVG